MKKQTISGQKEKAWKLFSIYIRRRFADWKGFTKCVTCGVVKPWKDMQAGHFIPGRHNSILFDDRGCFVQCYHCNIGLKGNPRAYDKFMRTNFPEIIDELEELDRKEKRWTISELNILIENLKLKIDELSRN